MTDKTQKAGLTIDAIRYWSAGLDVRPCVRCSVATPVGQLLIMCENVYCATTVGTSTT